MDLIKSMMLSNLDLSLLAFSCKMEGVGIFNIVNMWLRLQANMAFSEFEFLAPLSTVGDLRTLNVHPTIVLTPKRCWE